MGKQDSEHKHSHDENCSHDEEDIDLDQEVINKIKEVPVLADKVQLIALNGFLKQKKALDEELQKELNKVGFKYRQMMSEHLTKINEIIEGQRALTVEDFAGVENLLTPEELAVRGDYLKQEVFQEFWLKVLKNSETVSTELKEHDEPILKHLIRIEGEKSEDDTRLILRFHFSENEFFTNKVIRKEFLTEGDEIKKSEGDVIDWKEGKNVTVQIVKKKQKNKKTGAKKVTEKQVKQDSFFNFFNAIDLTAEDEEGDEDNEEGDAELDQKIEDIQMQHEIAQNLYEDVIPHQIEYYLGVGGLGDAFQGGFEDAELEEEDDEDAPKPLKGKGKKGGDESGSESAGSKSKSKSKGKDKKGGKQPAPECKQQ